MNNLINLFFKVKINNKNFLKINSKIQKKPNNRYCNKNKIMIYKIFLEQTKK